MGVRSGHCLGRDVGERFGADTGVGMRAGKDVGLERSETRTSKGQYRSRPARAEAAATFRDALAREAPPYDHSPVPTSPKAGKPADPAMLVDVPRLLAAYGELHPDPSVPDQRVAFGTSGHRGTSGARTFNEDHILAITQAICEYRAQQSIDGPLFLGIDTHALSEPAFESALEVLAANDVTVMIDDRDGYTPTPVLSHAILTYNRDAHDGSGRRRHRDAVAQSAGGRRLQVQSAEWRSGGHRRHEVDSGPRERAAGGIAPRRAARSVRPSAARADDDADTTTSTRTSAISPSVIDFDAIRGASLSLGVDPLGGAGVAYWGEIADRYRIPLTVVSDVVDPTFRFMTSTGTGRFAWTARRRTRCSASSACAIGSTSRGRATPITTGTASSRAASGC